MKSSIAYKAIDQIEVELRSAYVAGVPFSRVEFLSDSAFRIENGVWVKYISISVK